MIQTSRKSTMKKFFLSTSLIVLIAFNYDAEAVNTSSTELHPAISSTSDNFVEVQCPNLEGDLRIPSSELPQPFQMPYSNIGFISNLLPQISDYFLNFRDSNTGLFVDAGSADDLNVDLGIAPTGYGLTALPMAVEYGLIDRNQAQKLVEQTLQTLLDMQNKELEYEKDLITYLEAKVEGMEPGEEKDALQTDLNGGGWKRFWALEGLRRQYELDFLKEEKGLGGKYAMFLKGEQSYYREHPNERFDQEQSDRKFITEYSPIYQYGRWGFFYRYMGRVEDKDALPQRSLKDPAGNDLSTVDTGIGLAGVLTSGYYFGGKAWELAQQIYKNVDWHMMMNPSTKEGKDGGHPDQISFAWLPMLADNPDYEHFMPFYWGQDFTEEAIVVAMLAMGSPNPDENSISTAFFGKVQDEISGDVYKNIFTGSKLSFDFDGDGENEIKDLIASSEGGLWTYYMNIWFDTDNKVDPNGISWSQNSVKAVLANRGIVLNMKDDEGKTLAERYDTFNPNSWAITTELTPLRGVGNAVAAGYRMNVGVLRESLTPAQLNHGDWTSLTDKEVLNIPPVVAPNGYAGSIKDSIYSYFALRFLASTEAEIMGKDGMYDAFSHDIGPGGADGEWVASTQVAFSMGQFLQLFNLLGAISESRSIGEITSAIPYMQNAYRKAGFQEISAADVIPDELSDGMRDVVAGGINTLAALIDSRDDKAALSSFDSLMDNYLLQKGTPVGEYDELVRVLNSKIEEQPFNPLLYYMVAETRMAQIRDLSFAATGERYLNKGDSYKTLEALKYYFQNVDSYYREAADRLKIAEANSSNMSSDLDDYLLKVRMKALDFVITKDTFSDYNRQKELFMQLAYLIHEPQGGLTNTQVAAEIAPFIYRFDYEGELCGVLSQSEIEEDLLYWEEDYDFTGIRTAVYPRLEKVNTGNIGR